MNDLIIVFNTEIFDKGGAPEDYRQLFESINQIGTVDIVYYNPLPKEGVKTVYGVKEVLSIREKYNNTVGVYIGYSNIETIKYFYKYNKLVDKTLLLPVNQINEFLDTDNPFDKKVVPSIDNLNKNIRFKKDFIKRSFSGEKGFLSYVRNIKRWLYRKTYGKYLIAKVDKIAGFSQFELEYISKLYPDAKEKLYQYELGTSMDTRADLGERFSNNKINITMWSRIDYYYKGVDTFLDLISIVKDRVSERINFNIIGPSYNGGLERLKQEIESKNLSEIVFVITPDKYKSGSYGYFLDSDYIVSFSRWDGFPRTLREAVMAGKSVIANKQSNFDTVIQQLSDSYLIEDDKDFCHAVDRILKTIPEENYYDLSWSKVAEDFYKKLIKTSSL